MGRPEAAVGRSATSTAPFGEMIVSYWREVGVDATTKEITEQLYNERMRNSQVHVGVWHADRCTDMLLHIEPHWFIPTHARGDQGGHGLGAAEARQDELALVAGVGAPAW